MPLDSTSRYECPVCKKKYARQEHLNRHASSHTSACPFVCMQCGKRFKRSDILRRHHRSCAGAAPGTLTSAWSGGTTNARKRVCKTCVKQKRRCSLDWPCANCASQDRYCEYPSQARVFKSEPPDFRNDSPFTVSNEPSDESANDIEGRYDSDGKRHTSFIFAASLGTNYDAFDVSCIETATLTRSCSNQNRTSFVGSDLNTMVPQPMILLQDPADSFSFLVTFTRNEGIVPVFESDHILKLLRQASKAMLERGKQFLYGTWESENEHGNDDFSELSRITECLVKRIACPSRFDDHIFDSHPLDAAYAYEQDLLTAAPSLWHGDPLALKLRELTHAIQNQMSDVWSLEVELECVRFFSPPKVQIFLEAYWSIWSPHWPALHRPTFDPLATPIPLLAALVIIGACHSPNPNDREDAKYWFDHVENLVYGHLGYLSAKWRLEKFWLRKKSNQRQAVQAIQAAYAVSVYQNWNGTISAQSRTRRERWDSIVDACRSFGFSRATHGDMEFMTLSTFDWHIFIANEEAIRTFLWVSLVDVAFTMFHGIAPRVKLNELKMSLASSEACFQAETAEQCFEHVQTWLYRTARQRGTSLFSLITAFCKIDMDDRMLNHLAYEAFVNMWCVVCSFHVMLYHLTLLAGSDSRFAAIRTGLKNWKAMFNQRCLNNDERYFDVIVTQPDGTNKEESSLPSQTLVVDEPGLWKRLGFWKHAPEFWLLANVQLEQLQYSSPDSHVRLNSQGCEELTLIKIKGFIERYRQAKFAL